MGMGLGVVEPAMAMKIEVLALDGDCIIVY